MHDQDRWLEGVELADLDKIRERRVAEMKRRRESRENELTAMTEKARAEIKYRMSKYMLQGETVSSAIKRMRKPKHFKGKKSESRSSHTLTTRTAATCTTSCTEDVTAGTQGFDEFVALANMLMDDGNLDTYSLTKEDLEIASQLMLAAPQSVGGQIGNNDDDDDMFADNDDDWKNQTVATQDNEKTLTLGSNGITESVLKAHNEDEVQLEPLLVGSNHNSSSCTLFNNDTGNGKSVKMPSSFASWPIKELRRFLRERDHIRLKGFPHPSSLINEKSELIAAAEAAAAFESRINEITLLGFNLDCTHQSTSDLKHEETRKLEDVYIHDRLRLYYYPESDAFFVHDRNEWLYKLSDSVNNEDGHEKMKVDGMYASATGVYFYLKSGMIYTPETQQWQ